jgi:hypothetical protein
LAVLGHQYPRRHGGILQRVDGRRRHQSTVSPSSSLTPMRLRLTLPAVLTPTCASIRITGKRAGHEELLPSPPRLQSPSVASSGARCQRGSFWSNPATNRRSGVSEARHAGFEAGCARTGGSALLLLPRRLRQRRSPSSHGRAAGLFVGASVHPCAPPRRSYLLHGACVGGARREDADTAPATRSSGHFSTSPRATSQPPASFPCM